jgi:hypothetical protein
MRVIFEFEHDEKLEPNESATRIPYDNQALLRHLKEVSRLRFCDKIDRLVFGPTGIVVVAKNSCKSPTNLRYPAQSQHQVTCEACRHQFSIVYAVDYGECPKCKATAEIHSATLKNPIH